MVKRAPEQIAAAHEFMACMVKNGTFAGKPLEAMRVLLDATKPATDGEIAVLAAKHANEQFGERHREQDEAAMLEVIEREWDRSGEEPWTLAGRDFAAGWRAREGRR